jgi:hypothetical protein
LISTEGSARLADKVLYKHNVARILYIRLKEYSQAEKPLEEALARSTENSDVVSLADCQLMLAGVWGLPPHPSPHRLPPLAQIQPPLQKICHCYEGKRSYDMDWELAAREDISKDIIGAALDVLDELEGDEASELRRSLRVHVENIK